MTEIKSRLTIIGEPFKKQHPRYYYVTAKCECGVVKDYEYGNVKRKHTTSCGCYKLQRIQEANTTHGQRKHPLSYTWNCMKQRCYNKNNPQYKDYGGRGITVCDEWRNDFKVFYDWAIENNWIKGIEVDRINNNGNYGPNNCRLVTSQLNNQNRRTTKLVDYQVSIIKKLYKMGAFTKSELASIFSISQTTTGRIIGGKIWANIA